MESTEPHATLKKMPIDYLAQRPRAACDTETFPNLWAIGFRDVETKRIVKLMRTDTQELDRARVAKIIRHFRIYTFNGVNYDLPMIALAMTGATCTDLKRANDEIIVGGLKWWEFYDKYELTLPNFLDHVDLMEVAPSAAQRASLKKYAGMMHSRTMMESLHNFDEPLDDDGIEETMAYLDNDLEVTCDLIEELTPQIEIRAHISVEEDVDMRSKSDAQVAETVIKKVAEKRNGGRRLFKPDIVPGAFKYEAPPYIRFETPEMQAMLSRLLRSNFIIKRDGYVQLPDMFGAKAKKDADAVEDTLDYEGGSEIVLGGNVYKMGIGGLHSQEKSVSHYSNDDEDLTDVDAASFYPKLILGAGKAPRVLRDTFLPTYKRIVDERLAAKSRIKPLKDRIAAIEKLLKE